MVNKYLDFKSIDKYGLKLRLVEESDAEFIVQLRTDKKLGRYISPTSVSLDDQINWIRTYKEREKRGEEYYFITIDSDGERWGTTRLSELNGEFFELGSWLFHPNAPAGVAIKADIITKEIGFDNLGFQTCKFNVRKSNTKVLKYHKGYRPIVVKEDELDINYNLHKEAFEVHRDKLIKLL